MSAQQALLDRGFDPNGVDGAIGGGTRKAIREFQQSEQLEVTERFDPETLRLLGLGGYQRPADQKVRHSPDELPALELAQAGLSEIDVHKLKSEGDWNVRIMSSESYPAGQEYDEVIKIVAWFEDMDPYPGYFRFWLMGRVAGDRTLRKVFLQMDRVLGLGNQARPRCVKSYKAHEHDHIFVRYELGSSPDKASYYSTYHSCTATAVPAVVDYNIRFVRSALVEMADKLNKQSELKQLKTPALKNWLTGLASGAIAYEAR